MKALINETERDALLKEKIDYCMENEIEICISIESAFINLLHTIYVEDYRINNDYLFVSSGDFEFTISFENEMQVTYDEEQNCIKFKSESDQSEQEIALFILEWN